MFNIFKKNKKELSQDIDLSILNTDIHSHFIPGIDDGSKSMEESIFLLKQMEEFGYKKVITTPHVYYDSFLEGIEVLDQKVEELKVNAKFNGIKLQIEVGGEYLLDDDISDRIKNKQIKTFSDNFVLIEFPMTNQPMGYEKWLFDLQLAGYNIILAHPERFLYFYEDKKQYFSLKDRGIYFQMNIGSISGYYGNKVKDVAEYLIKENMIDLVGSDCHGQRHIDAIKRALRSPILKQLIESGKLINNKF